MRTLGTRRAVTRRAVLAAGVATVAALGGCSAGQVAETALKNPSTYGVNTQSTSGNVLIRGLAVAYQGTEGYPAGADAPLELNLYNESTAPVTVLISSRPPANQAPNQGVISAESVTIVGGAPTAAPTAVPEPSGSRPPATPDTETPDNIPSGSASTEPSDAASTEPSDAASTEPSSSASGEPSAEPSEAGRPARIEIPPLGSAVFRPGGTEKLLVDGLTDQLRPGMSVNLVFEFSDGSPALVTPAPVAISFTPASRAPGEPAEEHEPE